MDSFYVVLPSNTPFPGNKTSEYLVKLPNIIDLSDGNWSVALSSIIYPLSFSGVDEEQYISIYYENDKVTKINIPKRLQYSSVKQFENVLNDAILSSIFNETKVTSKPRSTRAVESKPRPPLKQPPESTGVPSVPHEQRPRPPLKETPTITDVPPASDQRPRPPLKQPVEPSLDTSKPDTESQVSKEHPVIPPTIDQRPRPPSKTIEPSTPSKTTDTTPEAPSTKQEEVTSDQKPKPPTKEEQPPEDTKVKEKQTEKPEAQIQLTEKDLQALETAKRVTNNIADELEEKYEQIEQYYDDAFALYDLTNETHVSKEAVKVQKLKEQIIDEAQPLVSLKNWFINDLNKAREAKLQTSIEYGRQNVKGAKISTDQIKEIKKKIITGKEEVPSLYTQIEKRYNKIVDLYEQFAETRGLPSAHLNTVYYQAKEYFDKTKFAFEELTNIIDELYNYMYELESEKEKDRDSIVILNPIVSIKSFSNGKYEEVELLKYQLEENFTTRNLEEEQKILAKIKEIKNQFINDEENKGFLPESRSIKEKFLQSHNKFKTTQALLKAQNVIEPISEEKTDSWTVSTDVNEYDRVFGEESLVEGHIPKTQVLKEKIDKETPDSWNIIASLRKELSEYRKGDIEKKIAQLLEKSVDLDGFKGLKRSYYQQIYLFFDADQLNRFYFWTSPDFNIKKIKISKQLAYMLGIETDSNDFINLNSFAKYSPDISGGLHSFYVYSPNLIANTVIGSQYGPLLRVVNVDLETKNKVVETIYTQEFHHKVILKQIPEINIRILSDTGRPIEFNWGNCIITLHFKRAIF